MQLNRKDLYSILYITIGALTLYLIYKEYENYTNNTSTSTTAATTLANTSTIPDYSNVGYSASLAPINFNVPNTSNGISASLNSFLSDNVGDQTNTNLANEYLNNSSFSSSNPLFTMTSPANIAQATDINTNTNMTLPSLSTPTQALNTNIINPSIQDLSQSLITQGQLNTDVQKAQNIAALGVTGGILKQQAAQPAQASVNYETMSQGGQITTFSENY